MMKSAHQLIMSAHMKPELRREIDERLGKVKKVVIVRLSPRKNFFDSDNNAISLKHIRDVCAYFLGLKGDADHRKGAVQWETDRQESDQWGVEVWLFRGLRTHTRTSWLRSARFAGSYKAAGSTPTP